MISRADSWQQTLKASSLDEYQIYGRKKHAGHIEIRCSFTRFPSNLTLIASEEKLCQKKREKKYSPIFFDKNASLPPGTSVIT
jgi:hypothetical protein